MEWAGWVVLLQVMVKQLIKQAWLEKYTMGLRASGAQTLCRALQGCETGFHQCVSNNKCGINVGKGKCENKIYITLKCKGDYSTKQQIEFMHPTACFNCKVSPSVKTLKRTR